MKGAEVPRSTEEVPHTMPKIGDIHDRLSAAEYKDVPDQFKALYVEDSGGYVYKDPKALRDSMVNAKNEKTSLAEELSTLKEKYKDVDPDEFRTLKSKAKDFEDIDKLQRGEIDKIKRELEDKWQGQVSERDKKLAERDARYANRILNDQIGTALTAAGATPKGAEVLRSVLKNAITTKMGDDGEPEFTIIDDKTKKQRLNDNADPYSIADLVEEAKKELPQLFGSGAGSGSGSGAQDKNVAAPTDDSPSQWSDAQRKAYITANGHDRYRALVAKEGARKAEERAKGGRKTA